MKKVYIASPYTIGDVAVNVRRQMEVANQLIDLGFVPFVPLYAHFQHMFFPRPYDEWLELDKQWVPVCDYLLRLEGESKGADVEVELADKLKIQVFHSIEEILEFEKILGLRR